jgi:uncharacterized protein with GYD domain
MVFPVHSPSRAISSISQINNLLDSHSTPSIMKTRIIVLIAAIVLSQFGISAATSSENSAARDLAAAKSLAFGGVGVAGLMSEGERNLRAVLERPDASQQLQAALARATPAGKLYILVGLRRCDRAAYQKAFDSLARPNDHVDVVRGCMVSKEPFRQVLSQVQDGRFDDFLSRPPR